MNLANHYRTFGHYQQAIQYIDTCESLSQSNGIEEIYNCYHRAERAAVHIALGEEHTAIDILKRIEYLIASKLDDDTVYKGIKGYLSIIYIYLGDAYQQLGKHNEAISYYQRSQLINDRYAFHNSNRSKTLENLAISHAYLQHYQQAYVHLQQSKALADDDWGAKSKKNTSFIEISDKFQKEIEQQRLALLEQENVVAEQKQRILWFRILLISLVSAIFLGLLLIRIKTQKTAFKNEKEDLE